MKKNLQTAFVVSLIAAAIQAHAGLIGYSSSVTGTAPASDENIGTEFFVNQALQVDSLGAFDNGDDGLDFAREVSLWRVSDSSLLASVIVPAGTLGTLDDGFRFASITPVSLTTGEAYRVSTFYSAAEPGDDYGIPVIQSPVSNVLLTGGSWSSPGLVSSFPGIQDLNFDERSAANFTTVSAVPEPSAVVTGLLCIGVAAFGVRRKYLARST